MLRWNFPNMPEFEAILFDFDGVLLDTEPVHWACWAEPLAGMGLTMTWEYYRDHCIGIDDRDMLRAIADSAHPPRDWNSLWALYPAKKKLFQERMIQPAFEPALDELLGQLGQQYKLAVVSSSACVEIEPLLVAGGLRHHFETIVGAEHVTNHKPAPDPYLLAARRMQSRTALVVEDSLAGAASGRAAGFEVLHVKHATEMPALLRKRLSGDLTVT
jgi:HAD superfamily hydrolase (TIGR01509 family)